MGRIGGDGKNFPQGHFPVTVLGREMLLDLKGLAMGGGNGFSLDQLLNGADLSFPIDLPGIEEPIQFPPQLLKDLGPLLLNRLRNRSETLQTFFKVHHG